MNLEALAVYVDNFKPASTVTEPIENLIDGSLGEPLTFSERRLRRELDGLTLAVGGPPCQGHSDLNNHTRRRDPKNRLYMVMARFIEVVRPRCFVIENVPGVLHDRGGAVLASIAALRAIGYSVDSGVVRADELGVPQSRRRHLLLGSRDGYAPSVADMSTDFAAPRRAVVWAIGDLDVEPDRAPFGTPASHAPVNRNRIDYLFDHSLYELPDAQRPDCHRLKPHSYNAVYGRMYPDRPAPTITSGFGSTGQGRFVHPHRRRTLTPHEAARVQGFPDFFSFSATSGRRALQEMIGNAVPSRLGYTSTLELLR
jgi:DNA (cytosine-5)-methyltransferase 1